MHVPEAELAAQHKVRETSAGNATGRSPISRGNRTVAAQVSKSFGGDVRRKQIGAHAFDGSENNTAPALGQE